MSKHVGNQYIQADWSAPASIKALVTTRIGGVSQAPYQSFNLASHVGDNPQHVMMNQKKLSDSLSVDVFSWVEQVHGVSVIKAEDVLGISKADAIFTYKKNIACCILTADCLPIFVTNQQGSFVAAIHAGWRGLASGIIENLIANSAENPIDLIVWIGPAISQAYFEVGRDVLQNFLANPHFSEKNIQLFFQLNPQRKDHYYADLVGLAKHILIELGVTKITGGNLCTYEDPEKFYSYRRDGVTGRQASLIWISDYLD